MTGNRFPLSVLDLALVGDGFTSAAALRASTALAQRAELLGYTRFWVAEHHNMPAVASTTPPVLIAHVAANTSTIRVGSGGVMLPNHPPLVVAEQFAMLEALHPGRIDLGIGRAPGTDPDTAAALRRSPDALGAEDFPQHLVELLALLGSAATPQEAPWGATARFSATPAAVSPPAVLLLGSSGFSAQLAGMLGLPFAFAHHFAGQNTLAAVELYRRSFQPSPALDRPYLIVTASVLMADTQEQAQWSAGPSQLLHLSLRTGRLRALHSPDEAAEHPQRELAAGMPTTQVVGTPDSAVPRLRQLVTDTQADELMVSTVAYSLAERVRSLDLLAQAWSVQSQPA